MTEVLNERGENEVISTESLHQAFESVEPLVAAGLARLEFRAPSGKYFWLHDVHGGYTFIVKRYRHVDGAEVAMADDTFPWGEVRREKVFIADQVALVPSSETDLQDKYPDQAIVVGQRTNSANSYRVVAPYRQSQVHVADKEQPAGRRSPPDLFHSYAG